MLWERLKDGVEGSEGDVGDFAFAWSDRKSLGGPAGAACSAIGGGTGRPW